MFNFFLFLQSFLPYQREKSSFYRCLICRLQMLSIWPHPKFCRLVMGSRPNADSVDLRSNYTERAVWSTIFTVQWGDIDLFDIVQCRFERDRDYAKLPGQGLDWFSRSGVRSRTYREPAGGLTTCTNSGVLTHSHTMAPFDRSGKQAFWKHCGKRKNCFYKQFLLFPQCFLLYQRQKLSFLLHLICCLQMLSIWSGHFGNGLTNFVVTTNPKYVLKLKQIYVPVDSDVSITNYFDSKNIFCPISLSIYF